MNPAPIAYGAAVVVGIACLLFSFFMSSAQVDIHFHDTYYIIERSSLIKWGACLILLISLLQITTRSLQWLAPVSWLHFGVSIVCILVVVAGAHTPAEGDFETFRKMNRMVSNAISLFILMQLLFIINLLAGVLIKLTGNRI